MTGAIAADLPIGVGDAHRHTTHTRDRRPDDRLFRSPDALSVAAPVPNTLRGDGTPVAAQSPVRNRAASRAP